MYTSCRGKSVRAAKKNIPCMRKSNRELRQSLPPQSPYMMAVLRREISRTMCFSIRIWYIAQPLVSSEEALLAGLRSGFCLLRYASVVGKGSGATPWYFLQDAYLRNARVSYILA